MDKLFVPYELAILLKEKGFNELCFGEYRQWDGNTPYLQKYQDLDECSTDPADYEYTTECKAPLHQQAIDWFRNTLNLHIDISTLNNSLQQIKIYKIRKFKDESYQLEEINSIGISCTIFENIKVYNKAIEEALKIKI